MKKSILFGLIGLAVGILTSGAVASYAVNNNNTGIQHMYAMNANDNSGSAMSMDAMTSSLANKTGDDFDKLFISEMIAHHQGAVAMAKLAQSQAGHQEIKDLSVNIIKAQTLEISQMQLWEMTWGYMPTTSMPGMKM